MLERVVVKGFRGVAMSRWIIAVTGNVAVITDDAGAAAVGSGAEPKHSVGFPKADVYRVPSEGITEGSLPDWTELEPYFVLH